MTTFEIILKDLRFNAFHGVLDEERRLGNEFIVNLNVVVPFHFEIEDDCLEGTVSYEDLFKIIKEEMEIPRNLLEKVALRIGQRIKATFPRIENGTIEIEKVRPPIRNMIGKASVKMTF